jgi:hypothetical protein
MLIYFIVVVVDNLSEDDRRGIVDTFRARFEEAERIGIVIVVAAGDQVGTVILMRLSALYELTILTGWAY